MSRSLRTKEQEVVQLAVQEGHDADIPTNEGVCLEPGHIATPQSPTSIGGSLFEKDIEKDANEASQTQSTTSLDRKDPAKAQSPSSANIVWWDGDYDPINPMNWPSARKWSAVAVVSGITFLTPLASSIFAPGVDLVMDEFNSTSKLLSGFVVSVYVLGFAFGPLIIAPMSEMYGRLIIYHICNVFFIIFNIGCAVSNSMGMLIVFRFLAGSFGAAPLTLGGATIADVMPISKRAKAMSVWVIGPTTGPVLGPIAGGFISAHLGWRWNFWILSIAAAVATILGFVLMRETYAPTLLERKANRLRKETGNQNLKSKLDVGLTPKDLFWFSIVRPTKMLLFSPVVLFLSIYVAITYAYLYLYFTTITEVFMTQYHFRKDLVGLSFLGLGVGQFTGQFLYSYVATKSYNKHEKNGGFKPEHRLHCMMIGAALIPVGLFLYGWTVQAKVQWMAPEVATCIFSLGLLFIWMPANVYLIDVYTIHAASAMAANTVLRSVVAAILPLAGPKMYAKLGYGWGNSLLGFIALLLIPIPLFFIKYGEKLRTSSKLKL